MKICKEADKNQRIFPLSRSFYNRHTLTVAKELLGKHLLRRVGGDMLIGKIVETEAYIGEDDPACHAARGKTPRNALMYGPPGFAYIYFILRQVLLFKRRNGSGKFSRGRVDSRGGTAGRN
jgi:DNA-3-methyladenine glycosylase